MATLGSPQGDMEPGHGAEYPGGTPHADAIERLLYGKQGTSPDDRTEATLGEPATRPPETRLTGEETAKLARAMFLFPVTSGTAVFATQEEGPNMMLTRRPALPGPADRETATLLVTQRARGVDKQERIFAVEAAAPTSGGATPATLTWLGGSEQRPTRQQQDKQAEKGLSGSASIHDSAAPLTPDAYTRALEAASDRFRAAALDIVRLSMDILTFEAREPGIQGRNRTAMIGGTEYTIQTIARGDTFTFNLTTGDHIAPQNWDRPRVEARLSHDRTTLAFHVRLGDKGERRTNFSIRVREFDGQMAIASIASLDGSEALRETALQAIARMAEAGREIYRVKHGRLARLLSRLFF